MHFYWLGSVTLTAVSQLSFLKVRTRSAKAKHTCSKSRLCAAELGVAWGREPGTAAELIKSVFFQSRKIEGEGPSVPLHSLDWWAQACIQLSSTLAGSARTNWPSRWLPGNPKGFLFCFLVQHCIACWLFFSSFNKMKLSVLYFYFEVREGCLKFCRKPERLIL